MRTCLSLKIVALMVMAASVPSALEHGIPVARDWIARYSVDGSDAYIKVSLYKRMRQKMEREMPETIDADFRGLRAERRLFSDGHRAWVVCGEFRLPGDDDFEPLMYVDRLDFSSIPSTLAVAFPVRNEHTAPIIERELRHIAIAERVGCLPAGAVKTTGAQGGTFASSDLAFMTAATSASAPGQN